jgi:hypothetical protein
MFHNLTGRYWGTHEVLGYDTVAALWWWKKDAAYYISSIPGVPVTIDDGGRCYPSGLLYNAESYYDLSGTWLWYDGSQWIISDNLGWSTDEYSETVDEVETWYGDDWWSCDNLTGEFAPRGRIKETGDPKTVAFGKVVGWTGETKFGVYSPEDDSELEGDKYAGWLAYRDSVKSQTFVDNGATRNDKPIFANGAGRYLWKGTSAWIISAAVGTKTATAGYWTGSALPGTFTRVWEATDPEADPPQEDPEPTAYSLAFLEYGVSVKSADTILAQVALWL